MGCDIYLYQWLSNFCEQWNIITSCLSILYQYATHKCILMSLSVMGIFDNFPITSIQLLATLYDLPTTFPFVTLQNFFLYIEYTHTHIHNCTDRKADKRNLFFFLPKSHKNLFFFFLRTIYSPTNCHLRCVLLFVSIIFHVDIISWIINKMLTIKKKL